MGNANACPGRARCVGGWFGCRGKVRSRGHGDPVFRVILARPAHFEVFPLEVLFVVESGLSEMAGMEAGGIERVEERGNGGLRMIPESSSIRTVGLTGEREMKTLGTWEEGTWMGT